MKTSTASLSIYIGLILFTAVTAVIGPTITSATPIREFGLDGVLLVAAGLLGVWLAPRTGFADLLDKRITNWQRFGRPMLVGLAFAMVDVLVFKLAIHPEPITTLLPFMQPFPYSVMLYGSGALYVDTLYRLLPIPLLMWLLGGLLMKDPKNERLFWGLALLTSLVEPLEQLITDSPALIVYSFVMGYAMNLLQALYFRRFGFLAGLSVRLGHYILWHIGFGLWIERMT